MMIIWLLQRLIWFVKYKKKKSLKESPRTQPDEKNSQNSLSGVSLNRDFKILLRFLFCHPNHIPRACKSVSQASPNT